jgi:hypothetical protein
VTGLILLIALAFIGAIARKAWQQHQENGLRTRFPQRPGIEVSLPAGVDDSGERMKRFLRKAVAAAQGGAGERKSGQRQIDIVFLAEVRQGHTMPEVRWLLYADEDKMPALKKSIKQVFDGMASVMSIKPGEDPMEEIAAQLRPPEKAEKGHGGGKQPAGDAPSGGSAGNTAPGGHDGTGEPADNALLEEAARKLTSGGQLDEETKRALMEQAGISDELLSALQDIDREAQGALAAARAEG